jgi:hypothetical protein
LEDEKNALLDYIEENIEKHSQNGGVMSPVNATSKDQEIQRLKDQLEEAQK